MKEYKIQVEKTITSEEIDDLLTAALEGGITYWCTIARVCKEPSEKYDYLSEVLTRGGELELYDVNDRKWLTLTLENVLKYLHLIDIEDHDSDSADLVIQYAVFGELIYC